MQYGNDGKLMVNLASGAGGYLKTSASGRYIESVERHERILLNLCERWA